MNETSGLPDTVWINLLERAAMEEPDLSLGWAFVCCLWRNVMLRTPSLNSRFGIRQPIDQLRAAVYLGHVDLAKWLLHNVGYSTPGSQDPEKDAASFKLFDHTIPTTSVHRRTDRGTALCVRWEREINAVRQGALAAQNRRNGWSLTCWLLALFGLDATSSLYHAITNGGLGGGREQDRNNILNGAIGFCARRGDTDSFPCPFAFNPSAKLGSYFIFRAAGGDIARGASPETLASSIHGIARVQDENDKIEVAIHFLDEFGNLAYKLLKVLTECFPVNEGSATSAASAATTKTISNDEQRSRGFVERLSNELKMCHHNRTRLDTLCHNYNMIMELPIRSRGWWQRQNRNPYKNYYDACRDQDHLMFMDLAAEAAILVAARGPEAVNYDVDPWMYLLSDAGMGLATIWRSMTESDVNDSQTNRGNALCFWEWIQKLNDCSRMYNTIPRHLTKTAARKCFFYSKNRGSNDDDGDDDDNNNNESEDDVHPISISPRVLPNATAWFECELFKSGTARHPSSAHLRLWTMVARSHSPHLLRWMMARYENLRLSKPRASSPRPITKTTKTRSLWRDPGFIKSTRTIWLAMLRWSPLELLERLWSKHKKLFDAPSFFYRVTKDVDKDFFPFRPNSFFWRIDTNFSEDADPVGDDNNDDDDNDNDDDDDDDDDDGTFNSQTLGKSSKFHSSTSFLADKDEPLVAAVWSSIASYRGIHTMGLDPVNGKKPHPQQKSKKETKEEEEEIVKIAQFWLGVTCDMARSLAPENGSTNNDNVRPSRCLDQLRRSIAAAAIQRKGALLLWAISTVDNLDEHFSSFSDDHQPKEKLIDLMGQQIGFP